MPPNFVWALILTSMRISTFAYATMVLATHSDDDAGGDCRRVAHLSCNATPNP